MSRFEAEHVRPRPGRTLIAGSYVTNGKIDRRQLYPVALGVDMRAGPGVDVVHDLEVPFGVGHFAHVECLSMLEHARRPWLVAETLQALMESASTIHVQVPFIWRVHSYPDDYWRMTPSAIKALFPAIRWSVFRYESFGNLVEDPRLIPVISKGDERYLARTMVCGFGVKK